MGAKSQNAHNKKAVLDALEKSLGVVTTACKESGISRRTFYSWKEEDEEFAKAVNEIQEVSLDFAESKLLTRIKKEDTTAIIFYLKTKGKGRGYIERSDFNLSGGLSKIIFEDAGEGQD